MKHIKVLTATVLSLMLTGTIIGQSVRRASDGCLLAGSYRIDVDSSDKLYSAVRGARGKVPFQDQQQFFMDLSVRLTPPDLLAIECAGNRVTVGSSRAERVTFLADGRLRQERSAGGMLINSRISLTADTLTFVSTGRADDRLNVVFKSLDRGQRLEVTRRIYAEQLAQPIVIRSIYNRLSDSVNWDLYTGRQVAGLNDRDAPEPDRSPTRSSSNSAINDLRRALENWIDATNRRNIQRQMTFYMPRLQAFYLTRNTVRDAVRREKERAFQTARSISIQAEEPEIVFQNGGQIAIMRFRKSYNIADGSRTRSGIVIQELRWQRTPVGWRIFSERDVRVIR